MVHGIKPLVFCTDALGQLRHALHAALALMPENGLSMGRVRLRIVLERVANEVHRDGTEERSFGKVQLSEITNKDDVQAAERSDLAWPRIDRVERERIVRLRERGPDENRRWIRRRGDLVARQS